MTKVWKSLAGLGEIHGTEMKKCLDPSLTSPATSYATPHKSFKLFFGLFSPHHLSNLGWLYCMSQLLMRRMWSQGNDWQRFGKPSRGVRDGRGWGMLAAAREPSSSCPHQRSSRDASCSWSAGLLPSIHRKTVLGRIFFLRSMQSHMTSFTKS